ncbi:glycosyltransferase family 4 protein [Actinomadura terrae]|uniref:glycosyltransferase family 4 protein n=1 Tax=Actinomadura terrae TaxID=604353 RepID=UPI001FA76E2C|nr:glycosyltransferase family 4 protein [Actinomadura terrae]
MRVLIHSAFPPLRGRPTGGAQRYADGLLTAQEGSGLRFTWACPPVPDAQRPFVRRDVKVVDELRAVDGLRVAGAPGTAETTGPVEVHHDLCLLARLAVDADVVVTIDVHFPLRTGVPVVLWLNNLGYPPETRSVFGLNWDAAVVPSDYLARCLRAYLPAERWCGVPPPVRVISPGLDVHEMDAPNPDDGPCLTFPHRPDPGKGFGTAARAVAELRRRGHGHRLLVPEPPPGRLLPQHREHVRERRALVRRLGLEGAVAFHDWVPGERMPGYLRRGQWALCPSELPESFGLAMVEPLAVGVPVIATPAGAVAETVPPGHGVELVEFGDWHAVADRVERGLPREEVERGRAYVARELGWERCASGWRDALAATRKSYAQLVPGPVASDPPWIRTMPSGRRWHDYEQRFLPEDEG